MDYEKSKKAIAAAKTPEELRSALERAYIEMKSGKEQIETKEWLSGYLRNLRHIA